MNSYSETEFHHIVDTRSETQRCYQHQVVETIVQRNLHALRIQLTPKRKVTYHPRQKKRVDLGEGWYCYITDSALPARHTVLTLHGAPGDHVEWAGLETQMGESCRWINLTLPGFDKEDERRGNYDGSASHVSELIMRLLAHQGVGKVILCAHSLGSIFSSYFITHHPQWVEGYVNVTGIVDLWYTGLLTFYQTTVAEWGYNSQEWRRSGLINKDSYRQQMHQKFLKIASQRSMGPVAFPNFCLTELMSYIRLINGFPNGVSELYYQNSQLKVPRVLIFGEKDPIHEPQKTEECIYRLCRGPSYFNRPKFQRQLREMKGHLEGRLRQQFGVEVQAEHIQEYFCYLFEDTGHNAHKRRPIEMSKIMKVYMVFLEVLEEYQEAPQPKL